MVIAPATFFMFGLCAGLLCLILDRKAAEKPQGGAAVLMVLMRVLAAALLGMAIGLRAEEPPAEGIRDGIRFAIGSSGAAIGAWYALLWMRRTFATSSE